MQVIRENKSVVHIRTARRSEGTGELKVNASLIFVSAGSEATRQSFSRPRKMARESGRELRIATTQCAHWVSQ